MVHRDYKAPIAVHPGETIKDAIEYFGITQTNVGIRAGIAEKTISEIINGKNPVTPETALKLELVLGLSSEILLGMQSDYNACVARQNEEERLKEEVKYLKKFPCYKDLVKMKYVPDTKKRTERVRGLLAFFSVNSLGSLKELMPSVHSNIAYRKSNKINVDKTALAAWLRIGEIEAHKIKTNNFNKEKVKNSLMELRSLTVKNVSFFSKELKRICADCGIALVYTDYLPKTYVNGATRWASPNKAILQLTLRYKYADIFWFTFFHELAHLLKHSKKNTFIKFDKAYGDSDLEKEADQFAQDLLIPKGSGFHKLLLDQEPDIYGFSKKIGVHPGIVAGRIGKEKNCWKKVHKYRQMLELKV